MQRKYVLNDKLFSLEIVIDLQISTVISVYRRFSCGYTSLHLHQLKLPMILMKSPLTEFNIDRFH